MPHDICHPLTRGLVLLAAFVSAAHAQDASVPRRDPRPIAAHFALPATTLPAFSYPRLGGGAPISNATLRGAPALVLFWSTYCGYGRGAVDAARELDQQYRARGVRTIVLAGNTLEELRAFDDSTRSGLSYGVAGGEALQARFDQSASAPERDRYRVEWVLPVSVVLDRDGRVVSRQFGTGGVLAQRAVLDSLVRQR
jgi:thiol-disulfide isomerase/thioredoxin